MVFHGSRIKYLENIPATPKREMILSRLGYRKNTTVLSHVHQELLEAGIKEGLLLCNVKGAMARFRIIEHGPLLTRIENNVVLESESLAKFLSESDEIVLMAVTAGAEVVERIFLEVKEGNAALGTVLDSVASETPDAGLDWIAKSINGMLGKEGKRLTRRRYSPGYGDLSLFHQKVIYDVLHLERLGLTLTEKYMLVPEKSVIAIAGIEGKA